MIELTVSSRSPAAVTAALRRIRDMVMRGDLAKTSPVHLVLEPGVYREVVRYNQPNPLIMECPAATAPGDCVIQADNCEAFHRGLENRAVFYVGPSATRVTLRNLSIVNTHNKASEGNPALDAAEALAWNNTSGILSADRVRLEGRQNTLYLRGAAHFVRCAISGDTDFIYGDASTAVFEDCEVVVREDNRGDFPAYAVKSLAPAEKTGFVFSRCTFSAIPRIEQPIFAYRTAGKGGASGSWDSAAFINCTFDDCFDPELAWDDDLALNIYPRGNARTGLREYGSLLRRADGSTAEADTVRRNVKSYTLTDDDYYKWYASRYLIVQGSPLEGVHA